MNCSIFNIYLNSNDKLVGSTNNNAFLYAHNVVTL